LPDPNKPDFEEIHRILDEYEMFCNQKDSQEDSQENNQKETAKETAYHDQRRHHRNTPRYHHDREKGRERDVYFEDIYNLMHRFTEWQRQFPDGFDRLRRMNERPKRTDMYQNLAAIAEREASFMQDTNRSLEKMQSTQNYQSRQSCQSPPREIPNGVIYAFFAALIICGLYIGYTYKPNVSASCFSSLESRISSVWSEK
jgi:hypothetical protein